MKIDLKTLAASGFRLELPSDAGPSDVVGIAGAVGLGGTYLQDARRISLEGFHAETLRLATVEWQLASGRVSVGADTELGVPRVDLDLPRGDAKATKRTRGKLSALRLRSPDVRAELGDLGVACALEASAVAIDLGERGRDLALRVDRLSLPTLALRRVGLGVGAADVDARGLALERGPEGTRLELAEATLSRCSIGLGDVELHADEARLVRPRVALATGEPPSLHVTDLVLEGVTLRAPGWSLRAASLTLHGLSYEGGALAIARVGISGAEIAMTLATGESRPAPAQAPPPSRRAKRRPLDLSFLDGLDGRVDVDVHVDAKVPYLQRRRATHHFRVAVKHGALDFKKLEGDLSALEDALLDFAIRKGHLVLEVSPPLLPFVRKTIVEWKLDDEGRALAERRLVRLATLVAPTLPTKGAPSAEAAGDPSFAIEKLDLDPIDVELHLAGGHTLDLGERGTFSLGAPRRAAVGKLRLRGAVHHRPGQASPRPTELFASAEKLRLGVESLALAGRVLSIEDASLEALESAKLSLLGLRPTAIDAKLGELVLRGVRLG